MTDATQYFIGLVTSLLAASISYANRAIQDNME